MEKEAFLSVEEKIGETLIRFGAIKQRQVNVVLHRQQCGDSRRFGEIAVALKYIGSNTLNTYLEVKDLPLWSRPEKSVKVSNSHQGQWKDVL